MEETENRSGGEKLRGATWQVHTVKGEKVAPPPPCDTSSRCRGFRKGGGAHREEPGVLTHGKGRWPVLQVRKVDLPHRESSKASSSWGQTQLQSFLLRKGQSSSLVTLSCHSCLPTLGGGRCEKMCKFWFTAYKVTALFLLLMQQLSISFRLAGEMISQIRTWHIAPTHFALEGSKFQHSLVVTLDIALPSLSDSSLWLPTLCHLLEFLHQAISLPSGLKHRVPSAWRTPPSLSLIPLPWL